MKKEGGISTDGKIKPSSYFDRCRGVPDLLLTVDVNAWTAMSGGQREALLDHLLTHYQPRHDKDDTLITDKAKRPKLDRRAYSWHVAGFDSVVKDHGSDAPEFIAAKQMKDEFGQLLMFAEDAMAVG